MPVIAGAELWGWLRPFGAAHVFRSLFLSVLALWIHTMQGSSSPPPGQSETEIV